MTVKDGDYNYDTPAKSVYPYPYPPRERFVGVSLETEKRRYRDIALQAALKLSSVAEPEKRLLERAQAIYNFLYGEDK